MRVTIYQFDIVWMNPNLNFEKIESICKKITGKSDLLVLPEMFNTGYTMSPSEIPTIWQSETIDFLKLMAQNYNVSICGSIPFERKSNYYNTFIFVGPEGLTHSYDKVHLFTPAGEKAVYSAGQNTQFIGFYNFEIQPLICYDLRFPYISYRNEKKDIIIYSANWPRARVNHWKVLLQARAIENQCFVIGVNRTGSDNNGYDYPGSSMIIDYAGHIITELNDQPNFETHTFDLNLLNEFRTKLPFLNDRQMNK